MLRAMEHGLAPRDIAGELRRTAKSVERHCDRWKERASADERATHLRAKFVFALRQNAAALADNQRGLAAIASPRTSSAPPPADQACALLRAPYPA